MAHAATPFDFDELGASAQVYRPETSYSAAEMEAALEAARHRLGAVAAELRILYSLKKRRSKRNCFNKSASNSPKAPRNEKNPSQKSKHRYWKRRAGLLLR